MTVTAKSSPMSTKLIAYGRRSGGGGGSPAPRGSSRPSSALRTRCRCSLRILERWTAMRTDVKKPPPASIDACMSAAHLPPRSPDQYSPNTPAASATDSMHTPSTTSTRNGSRFGSSAAASARSSSRSPPIARRLRAAYTTVRPAAAGSTTRKKSTHGRLRNMRWYPFGSVDASSTLARESGRESEREREAAARGRPPRHPREREARETSRRARARVAPRRRARSRPRPRTGPGRSRRATPSTRGA